MHIKGLTVSVDYADYLALALPTFLPHVNEMLVVTSPHDQATQFVCQRYHCPFITTEAFWDNGNPFNRGRGYIAGIDQLKPRGDEWLMLLDADILLPRHFSKIRTWKLEADTMYTCLRYLCETPEQYKTYLETGHVFHLPQDRTHGKPIGYLQLVNAACGHPLIYPNNYPQADGGDLAFAAQWKKYFWMDLDVVHLGPAYVNWRGRVSPEFKLC